jgi:hypothetical protein
MYLIQIKHAQIKFPLFGFWTVFAVTLGGVRHDLKTVLYCLKV